jgi:hypothetical protein
MRVLITLAKNNKERNGCDYESHIVPVSSAPRRDEGG